MPGVVVTTGVRKGPNGLTVAPASSFFLVGTAERGSVIASTPVTSLEDFEAAYGDYIANKTLHQQVQTFFEEGGARAYVARVVGASASAGTKTLNAAGPTPAVTLTAANPGSWSANMDVVVTSGTGGGFIVKLYVDDVLQYSSGEVANVNTLVGAIAASSIASLYITATALSGSSVLVPASLTAFSTGNDGATPVDADIVNGLALFGSELGAGAVAAPGSYSDTVYAGLISHAVANNRIVLAGFNPAFAYTDAIAAADNYYEVTGAEYAAFYYPQVQIPGPANSILTISPEGYVAAKRSLALNKIGPWQAAAGVQSQADFVSGISTPINKTVGDALDAARVNAIRVILNSVRVYGARSVSDDETDWRYITYRDFMNYLVVQAETVLEDLVFSVLDGRGTVFGRTEARLVALLEPIRIAGGLYEAFDDEGNQLDPGYSVEVSNALNPVSNLQQGIVTARVGVRPSSVGDKIYVTVVKSNLTSTVV